MGITEEQVAELVSFLKGSDVMLGSAMLHLFGKEEGELSDSNRFIIDNEIFCCVSCAWWGEFNERSEDGENCLDCFEE